MDPYLDREQTLAKHYILKRYLQELAFKILRFSDLTYIDGFSGPWESRTADFSDTSFKIAIDVLHDAQDTVAAQTGTRRNVRCFFSEAHANSFALLQAAVSPFHDEQRRFQIKTFNGNFEDAVTEIQSFTVGFSLVFIDPTGWTGYAFPKISRILQRTNCEVVVNFMYSFVSRFLQHPDEKIINSLNPILGGSGWQARLDPALKSGLAVEKLFRDTLKEAGRFQHVVSTCIQKSTEERPHFFIAYGTKSRAGLIAFREVELRALRNHARRRSEAKTRKVEAKTGLFDMFADHAADREAEAIDELVSEQTQLAKTYLLELLSNSSALKFGSVVEILLESFMVRETNVKTICHELGRDGLIEKSWGGGNRRPDTQTIIRRT